MKKCLITLKFGTMKISTILLVLVSLISCEQKKPKSQTEKLQDEIRLKEIRDSIGEAFDARINEDLSDTDGIHKAPVQITKARFVEKDYSNYKDIQLTYKNVSGKDIDAIRFKWTGTNAFGEPADVGSVYGDVGGGFTDSRLRAGKTTSGTWSILSRDGKKVTKAWAYEVVFSDGTKWEFKPD